MKIGLVSACHEQEEGPLPAEELFTSPLFRVASRYCRERYFRWFILSDRLVLLPPDAVNHQDAAQAHGVDLDKFRAVLKDLGLVVKWTEEFAAVVAP
jgi:hypothetical protein